MEEDTKAEEIDLGIQELGPVSELTRGLVFGCFIDGVGGGGNHPPTYFCS